MAIKRKFEAEEQDFPPRRAKQLRFAPFSGYERCLDVEMSESDASSSPVEPFTPQRLNHPRVEPHYGSLAHNPSYPSFSVTPQPFFGPDGRVNTNSHNFAVLVQPQQMMFR